MKKLQNLITKAISLKERYGLFDLLLNVFLCFTVTFCIAWEAFMCYDAHKSYVESKHITDSLDAAINTATQSKSCKYNRIYFKWSKAAEYEMIKNTSGNDHKDSMDIVKNLLINEVDSYIKKHSDEQKMRAEHIVNECVANDFDIPLLLSQAQNETAMGNTAHHNSCFGITSRQYTSTDKSVTDYINIMKEKYLKNQSVDKLIASGFYVEGSSKYKYAENPEYPQKIKATRDHIKKSTKIHSLYAKLKKLSEKRQVASETREWPLIYNPIQ